MQCSACGTRGLSGKFCTECGTKLDGAGPRVASSSSRTSLPSASQPGPAGTGVAPARRVSRPGAGGVARVPSGGGARPVVPSSSTAGATYSALARQPTTTRGQGIKQAMDDLADEMYGTDDPTPMRPDLLRQAQVGASARFSRPVVAHQSLGRGWEAGPANQEGNVFSSSDRNILCMDVQGDEVVVGGADHGLRVYDVRKGREVKCLYTKRFGHTDWVTSCAYLPDGRVVSGGQDSKLCVWAKAGVRCNDLTGHTASVSEVQVGGSIAISCSYDRTLKVWDCDRLACVGTLSGHRQPVMEFLWKHTTLVSGDRGGAVRAWDPETETCVGILTSGTDSRRGQCSALGWYGDSDGSNLVMAGDQTGRLRVWDLRAGPDSVTERMLHPGGALTGIKSAPGYVVTCGADKSIKVLDGRSLDEVHTIATHKDFIYSLETIGDKAVSGDGRGWLLVHDLHSAECHFGLGANQAAVRCIHPQPYRLIASGDDGSLIAYDM